MKSKKQLTEIALNILIDAYYYVLLIAYFRVREIRYLWPRTDPIKNM